MTSPTLYHYWRSSCSWRIRWSLQIKGLAYKLKSVNLLKQEQRSHEYLSIVPAGQVPAFTTEQGLLVESVAILEWLEEQYPDPALLPKSPWAKAQIRALSQIIAAGTQPFQNLKVLQAISSEQSVREAFAAKWIQEGLGVFAKQRKLFGFTEGPFCAGDQLTLADLCLIPQIYNAHRFKIDMGQFTELELIYQNCLQLESCKASHPDRFSPTD